MANAKFYHKQAPFWLYVAEGRPAAMAFGEAKGTAQHARYITLGWLATSHIEKVQKKKKVQKKVGDVG
jgi:hypothetical protein